jgi:hypothetical protein
VRRRWRRRHTDEQRARLVGEVRRLAGWSHLVIADARRLGADVPDGVAACPLVWSHWADRLAEREPPAEPT